MALATGKHAVQWNYLATRLMAAALKNKDVVGNSSVDFLMYSGYASLAYQWLRIANVALEKSKTATGAEKQFYEDRVDLAQFYFDRVLPRTKSLATTILDDAKSTMKMKEDRF